MRVQEFGKVGAKEGMKTEGARAGCQKQSHKYLKRTLVFVADDISQSIIQNSENKIN